MLEAEPVPKLAEHLWAWFLEMSQDRGSNGMSESYISAQDMKDWCWRTGNSLDLWERQAIRAIDRVWMSTRNDR